MCFLFLTGFPVPVWSFSTCLGVNMQRFVDTCPRAGLHVLDNWVSVFVRFVGYLCCFQRHQNPNQTSNYLCRKFWVVVDVTHIPSGKWFLQISSRLLSRCNELGVYRRGRLRSILCTPYPGAFSSFLHDARRGLVKSSSCGSLWFWFMEFPAVENTVCLSLLQFCPPAINPEFVMECKLIAHPMW